MAIVTNDGHTSRAKEFFDKASIPVSGREDKSGNLIYPTYAFGIGRKNPWPDEDNPPAETEDEAIEDIICYARITSVNYVKHDESATGETCIEYRGKKYRKCYDDPTSEFDIWKKNCRHIIISAWLNYGEAPTGVSYRKIGLYSGTETTDHTLIFAPGKIANPLSVKLDAVANDTATHRSASKREQISMLIEF